MHHPLLDMRIAVRGDRIVGAVRHSWRERETAISHRLEIWVHPTERRQGLGRRLLEWGEARARESTTDGTGGPTDRPLTFSGNTSREIPAGVAFAEAMGYKPIRYHFEMRRPLDAPIPDVPLPDGLEVRPVLPEHHRAIWNADEEAFRDHWDHAVSTEDDFTKFFADPDIDTSLWQVAWDGDEVAGLVINGIYPYENERSGVEGRLARQRRDAPAVAPPRGRGRADRPVPRRSSATAGWRSPSSASTRRTRAARSGCTSRSGSGRREPGCSCASPSSAEQPRGLSAPPASGAGLEGEARLREVVAGQVLDPVQDPDAVPARVDELVHRVRG